MATLGSLKDLTKYAQKAAAFVGKPFTAKNKAVQLSLANIPSVIDDALADLDPKTLRSALDSAAEGEPCEQTNIILSMMDKDTIFGAHLSTRKEAVMACDMGLIDPTANKYDIHTGDQYADLWAMLETAGLRAMLRRMLQSIPIGYAAEVIDWGAGGATVLGFQEVHPTRIKFDMQGNWALTTLEDNQVGEDKPFGSYHPNQFARCTYNVTNGLPSRQGLGRVAVWLIFFKHFARKSWAKFIERFGLPFLISKITEADFENTALKAKLLKQLRDFSTNGAILTTQDGGVEAVTVAGHNNKIHEEFVACIDEALALLILGQVGSSKGEPGRLGGNSQQDEVRHDKKENDCRTLIEMVNTCIIQPYWLFTHGDLAGCPRFWMNFGTPDDRKTTAETFDLVDQMLRRGGKMIDPMQLAFEFGLNVVDAVTVEPPVPTMEAPNANQEKDPEPAD